MQQPQKPQPGRAAEPQAQPSPLPVRNLTNVTLIQMLVSKLASGSVEVKHREATEKRVKALASETFGGAVESWTVDSARTRVVEELRK